MLRWFTCHKTVTRIWDRCQLTMQIEANALNTIPIRHPCLETVNALPRQNNSADVLEYTQNNHINTHTRKIKFLFDEHDSQQTKKLNTCIQRTMKSNIQNIRRSKITGKYRCSEQ